MDIQGDCYVKFPTDSIIEAIEKYADCFTLNHFDYNQEEKEDIRRIIFDRHILMFTKKYKQTHNHTMILAIYCQIRFLIDSYNKKTNTIQKLIQDLSKCTRRAQIQPI